MMKVHRASLALVAFVAFVVFAARRLLTYLHLFQQEEYDNRRFLRWILENRGWDDAVRFAAATAALKHTIPGDFCLVTRGEVDQLLRGTSLRVSR